MLKGIDISVWQGKIDWSEVAKDENVKFAILRAGYGMYASQKDDRFASVIYRDSVFDSAVDYFTDCALH